MSALVEVQENGELRVPPQIHGWKPHTQVRAVHDGERVTLDPVQTASGKGDHSTHTPADRASKFRALIATLRRREGPEIPDEALRRENMYD